MPHFVSEGIEIAYQTYGEGSKPIVLVHGFASSGAINWRDTGWTEVLCNAGYMPVTIDNRGHGKSQKLYDPEMYPARLMAHDLAGLITHLDLGPVPVMGYSMGARICAFAVMDYPELMSAAIFGGLGINMVRGLSGSEDIAEALLAPSLEDVTSPVGRQFRLFAEHAGGDLKALAACMQSSRSRIGEQDLGQIEIPVLVAVGDEDELGGSPEELAALMPKGEALVIPGRDHMRATGDKVFKAGVLDFLARVTS